MLRHNVGNMFLTQNMMSLQHGISALRLKLFQFGLLGFGENVSTFGKHVADWEYTVKNRLGANPKTNIPREHDEYVCLIY